MTQTYPDLATFFEKTGISQAEFAAQLRTSQSYISRVAAGELVPRPEMAVRIAKAAHIPLDSFIRVYLKQKKAKQAA